MQYRIPAIFVLCLLNVASICQPASAADLRTFSDKERQTVDRRMLAAPDRRTEQPHEAFYGSIAGWSK